MGHSGCGAVKAVTAATQGHGHALEYNIPPLVDNIGPAVQRAIHDHKEAEGAAVVSYAIEENVWQSVSDLFTKSAAARRLASEGKIKVVGALYDIGTGKVNWLPEGKVTKLLAAAEANPKKQTKEFAGEAPKAEKSHH